MNRRRFLQTATNAAAASLLAPWIARAGSGTRPPNILLIASDDHGFEDLGCYRNQFGHTSTSTGALSPHLDALAQQGVRCNDFYVTSPVCTPCRVGLLTGRHPQRCGMGDNVLFAESNYGIGLPQDQLILPQLLKQRGYTSGCFGKWHLGWAPGSRPLDRGFDEFFGCPAGAVDYYTHWYYENNSTYGNPDLVWGNHPIRREGYLTDLITDATIGFMEQNRRRPFFAYVPHVAPHYPANADRVLQAPQRYLDLYPENPTNPTPSGYTGCTSEMRRGYLASISAMDDQIARLLATLDRLNLTEDTLVIFFSDNGGEYRYGGNNFPLRGQKRELWEGGVRTPCIVRWPGRIQGGHVRTQPFTQLDLFSLALAAAGASGPAGKIIDGRDPTALLADGAITPHEYLFFRYRHDGNQAQQWAIRQGSVASGGPIYKRGGLGQTSLTDGLYNLATDIRETTNLRTAQPAVATALQATYNAWWSDLLAANQNGL